MDGKKTGWRNYLMLNFNNVIRWMIISDLVVIGSYGLLAPIFAVFITDYIEGANIQVAGIAVTIFLITKSLTQIPIATLIDKIKGEKDDFWVVFIGSIIMSLIPLGYIFVKTVPQLYFIQAVYGIVTATTFPAYMAIFHRHLDKNKEGTELGVYYTLTDIGAAATGAIGGSLAYYLGFKWVFFLVMIFNLLGSLSLIFIKRDMKTGHWKDLWIVRK
ncbi:MAG: MFS transporter [Candidatus Buchananbacteria bacterium]|nr:MFS transporter [Candidatus Buchananbacteria bacterium]